MWQKRLLISLLVSLPLLVTCAGSTRPDLQEIHNTMVTVPAGWFLMGQDEGRWSHQPQRSVYLDAFAIDQTEVTNAAFGVFVEATGYQAPDWDASQAAEHSNEPVTGVLWFDANTYCQWVRKRLPTEAEWEKAARGTDGRRYPWGDEWKMGTANTQEGGRGQAMPVGSFPGGASPYGALDMAGNVAEWVADYFVPDYYRQAPERNPPGPSAVMDHGLRGGSWASPRAHAQTFYRDSSHSVMPNPRVGFRCAMTVNEAEAKD